MKRVPTLDMRRFDADRDAFVAELGAAYREFGFCCINHHGVPHELIADAYDVFRQFFALPVQTKMKYHQPGTGGARGYTPFKVETAKDSKYPDLKEFWHIGRELPPGSKYAADMAPNIWPAEVADFRARGLALYEALDALGRRLLRALALHIHLPEDWFEDKVQFGNSLLRPIHYPPVEGDVPNVRAGAHEDINFITLLVGASAAGLEVKTREGRWLPITTAGDAIVVNIGDMLQRLSNRVYPSTTHRVVNPPGVDAGKSRYSVPYFLHPNPDVVLDPLPQCVDDDHPSHYEGTLTAHQYLQQRLREIRLI